MSFTEEQSVMFSAAMEMAPGDVLVMQAPPGCGKSHMARAIANAYADRGMTVLVTAFNVAIVNDLARSFGVKVGDDSDRVMVSNLDKLTCRSLDADGRKLLGRFYSLGSPKVDTSFLAKSLGFKRDELGMHASKVAKLTENTYGRWCSSADDRPGWWHCPRLFDEQEDESRSERSIREAIADHAYRLARLIDAADGRSVRFPMVGTDTKFKTITRHWFANGAHVPGDVVIVDEAQDLPRVWIAAIDVWRRQGKRVILAGDRYQELYAWAGADNGMTTAVNKYGATEYRLTLSHRFPATIAATASRIIAPLAGPDSVQSARTDMIEDDGRDADAFLFPKNADAVAAALDMFGAGRKVRMPRSLTTEIETIVTDLIALDAGNRATGPLAYWSMDRLESAIAARDERVTHLAKMVELFKTYGARLLDLVAAVKADTDNPDSDAAWFTTIHRTKGQEWNTVEVWMPERLGKGGRLLPWTKADRMVAYVGATRGRDIVRIHGAIRDDHAADAGTDDQADDDDLT